MRVARRGRPRSRQIARTSRETRDLLTSLLFSTTARIVETHLLDFNGDLYGVPLATDLLERLRPDPRLGPARDAIGIMEDRTSVQRTR